MKIDIHPSTEQQRVGRHLQRTQPELFATLLNEASHTMATRPRKPRAPRTKVKTGLTTLSPKMSVPAFLAAVKEMNKTV